MHDMSKVLDRDVWCAIESALFQLASALHKGGVFDVRMAERASGGQCALLYCELDNEHRRVAGGYPAEGYNVATADAHPLGGVAEAALALHKMLWENFMASEVPPMSHYIDLFDREGADNEAS